MRVAIISPVANTGNTTASAMIAGALAYTQGINTTLMCTTTKARRLYDYLGMIYEEDITASITQLQKLIASNAVAPEECIDYLHKITRNLMVLDTTCNSLQESERMDVISHVFKSNVTPLTICDVHWDPDLLNTESGQALLESSDLIFVHVNNDKKNMEALKRMKDSGKLPQKQYALIVNSYEDACMSVRVAAQSFGFKVRYTTKIHRNPYIQNAENKGKLLDVVYDALTKDPRVIELNQDLKEICEIITGEAKMRLKWEV